MKRLLLVLAACSHDRVMTCADELGGRWQAPDGTRWFVIDNGPVLEGYPLDPDAPQFADHELVAAPRALDLTRTSPGLTGSLVRRYEQRATNCEGHAAVHIESCHDDTLELVTSDLAPPISVAPCRFGLAPPSHVERWQRLR